jgi:exodeoxyribonuclease-5
MQAMTNKKSKKSTSMVPTESEKIVKRFTSADLSPDQLTAFERILEWSEQGRFGDPIKTFGGLAGTGKTTVLGVYAHEAGITPLAFVAFTGKASTVLRRKLREAGIRTIDYTLKLSEQDEFSRNGGAPYCGTLHSLIYAPVELCVCTTCKFETNGATGPCPQRNSKDEACTGTIKSTGRVVGWARRDKLDRDYKVIIIDESSMLSDDMLEDLKVYGAPILAVGDHGQLSPVNGVGTLMRDPDIRLEHVHRQAVDNPIIKLAHTVRETGRLDTKLADGKHVVFDNKNKLNAYVDKMYKGITEQRLFEVGMLCYTNDRRVSLNALAREARGFSGAPRTGDQVICLRNNRTKRVFNGMRALITSDVYRKVAPKDLPAHEYDPKDWEPPWKLFAQLDFVEDGVKDEFSMCANQFNRKYTFKDYSELAECKIRVGTWEEAGGLFDFGYGLTVHKSQGSQFNEVLLIVDGPGRMGFDEYKRWLYTAITRAVDRITILI